jgi:hypothetical protein
MKIGNNGALGGHNLLATQENIMYGPAYLSPILGLAKLLCMALAGGLAPTKMGGIKQQQQQ